VTNEYVYIDENGVEYKCKNQAEHDRLWRDRYLSAAGLTYQSLVETKGKIVTVQIHPGEYGDDNNDANNKIEVEAVFLSLLVKDVIVALEDKGFQLEIEFKFEDFKIPINAYRSNPVEKVDSLNVRWVGCSIYNDDVWESRNLDDDKPGKGINCQPMFQAFCTSEGEFNPWTSDNYRINLSIVLPNGQVIGDLDPEEVE